MEKPWRSPSNSTRSTRSAAPSRRRCASRPSTCSATSSPSASASWCTIAGWHHGVIGLVASRLKDLHHRPCVALAPENDEILRGSGRSIPGVHLRDVLDRIDKRNPGMLIKFGGHAMAAGLSMRRADMAAFETAFDAAVAEMADPEAFSPSLLTDGPLDGAGYLARPHRADRFADLGPGFCPAALLRPLHRPLAAADQGPAHEARTGARIGAAAAPERRSSSAAPSRFRGRRCWPIVFSARSTREWRASACTSSIPSANWRHPRDETAPASPEGAAGRRHDDR